MVQKRRETKAEKLNTEIYRIVKEITKDKDKYPEANAMISKLKWISDQIMERVINKLKGDESES